ncbi:hypothetical protein FDP41_000551 [Naegleria fowleri]|uniref:Protein root UVB sensitive/RUS domain-containing protein n=1 Tax=Naegleria fowleri TaxID=5763 RepID=A0A6A5CC53_NAEFO|nr:uncharacterized protein FDP41_000551 [Naegleria fowleri]KAF0984652.1 hypothetical protein FDP41_000551 [Naegleria fowleri]
MIKFQRGFLKQRHAAISIGRNLCRRGPLHCNSVNSKKDHDRRRFSGNVNENGDHNNGEKKAEEYLVKQHTSWFLKQSDKDEHLKKETILHRRLLRKLNTEEIHQLTTDASNDSENNRSLDVSRLDNIILSSSTNSSSKFKFLLNNWRRRALRVFLPKNFPESVNDGYLHYCKWQALQYITGSFSGVLSMQSLLHAAGITSQIATTSSSFALAVLGGALAWVIKDGLGQLGGILFASKVNTNFDADPKFWRMTGEYALVASALLEVTTPLTGPSWFIAQASIANIGKNVSCFSASATRAAMNQSFAKSDNLADVTAKATSQALASSLIGTTLGILYSSAVSLAQFSFVKVFPVFCVLSVLQLFSLYKAASIVRLKVLNKQRFVLVCSQYLKDGRILNPTQISLMEKFVFPFFEKFQKVKINTNIEKIEQLMNKSNYEEIFHSRYTIIEEGNRIHILFAHNAQTIDVFRGMFRATQLLTDNNTTSESLNFDNFVQALSENGWSIDHDFVEDNTHMRIFLTHNTHGTCPNGP